MTIEIPGYKSLELKYLVLDYNGTIAVDGSIPQPVRDRICALARELEIYVLTADTHGTAEEMCADLPVKILTFPNDSAMQEKYRILQGLDADACVAMGNGRNDLLLCRSAALSVAVIGAEGTYGRILLESDICVTSIEDGLDLLLKPKRLIASLRG